MTAATEGIGSRSSRVNDGLASASTISASAIARTSAPRLRASSSMAEISTAAANAVHTTVGRHQRSKCDAEVHDQHTNVRTWPAREYSRI